jgi:hypothetical protein
MAESISTGLRRQREVTQLGFPESTRSVGCRAVGGAGEVTGVGAAARKKYGQIGRCETGVNGAVLKAHRRGRGRDSQAVSVRLLCDLPLRELEC